MIIHVLGALANRRDSFSEDHPFAVRKVADDTVSGLVRWEARVYNGTGTALTKNNWYEIRFDGDEETNPTLAAVASGSAGVVKYVCVATEAAAASAWTWVVIAGYYSPFVEGTTDVAKDDYLKFDSSVSTVAPIKDGSTPSTSSVAIACEPQTTAGNTTAARVFILGERIAVAA